ncbi:nuclear transport factor 2 family protein [uncultured Williamsia sp.]|uniref:nuclear transport factor 2 family protein n=1 Tax=uncultured Williamsia sp. TaxID=259311 RepID=UPI00262DE64E|nr:nuclear transport factor 2 family protein [uncultured Williamsia sp.]
MPPNQQASPSDLQARVERLEALDEIRQLAAKYAVALDQRDLDAVVGLFVDDVGAPGGRRGREALRDWYDAAMRRDLLGTAHGIVGHVIDVDGPAASGIVYSRNDLETESTWLVEFVAYLDSYERRDGRWWFRRRTPMFWYRSDLTEPPLGENKMRWPGAASSPGTFHEISAAWAEFWSDEDRHSHPVPAPPPADRWIAALRRDAPTPRVDPTARTD